MPHGTITPALPNLGASARLIARSLTHGEAPAGGPPLTLDLAGVTALTAGDLGQLVALHNRLRRSGGRLALCNAGPLPAEVLRLTRLTDLFEVRGAGRG
jgi:anti-anti-sigma regulatory factor